MAKNFMSYQHLLKRYWGVIGERWMEAKLCLDGKPESAVAVIWMDCVNKNLTDEQRVQMRLMNLNPTDDECVSYFVNSTDSSGNFVVMIVRGWNMRDYTNVRKYEKKMKVLEHLWYDERSSGFFEEASHEAMLRDLNASSLLKVVYEDGF